VIEKVIPRKGDAEVIPKVIPMEHHSLAETASASMTEVSPKSMTISDDELTEKITVIVEAKLKVIFERPAQDEDTGPAHKFTISMPALLYDRLKSLGGNVSGRITEAVRTYLNLQGKAQKGE
jgi:hypothetical protein